MLLGEERILAKLITDDHIHADERKMNLPDLFPNIQGLFFLIYFLYFYYLPIKNASVSVCMFV